jgi:hypothetical protein
MQGVSLRTLEEILLAPDVKPRVIGDCLVLIKEEVSDLSGISGAAIKVAYKGVSALAPDYMEYSVTARLPVLASALEPFWADFAYSGGGSFGDYLAKRSDQATDALLAATDAQAAGPTARTAVVKAYKTVRGSAAKHIANALPRVGALIQSYA